MCVCFCSDRLQNGISDDEAMLTNFVVCTVICNVVELLLVIFCTAFC